MEKEQSPRSGRQAYHSETLSPTPWAALYLAVYLGFRFAPPPDAAVTCGEIQTIRKTLITPAGSFGWIN